MNCVCVVRQHRDHDDHQHRLDRRRATDADRRAEPTPTPWFLPAIRRGSSPSSRLTDNGGTCLAAPTPATPGIASTVNFNIPPTIDVDGVVNYVENDAATSVDTTITITDTDDTNMEGANVVITSGYAPARTC